LQAHQRDGRYLHRLQIAAVGVGTAEALQTELGLRADLVAAQPDSHGLLQTLQDSGPIQSVYLLQAEDGSDVLPKALGDRCRVVPMYRTQTPTGAAARLARASFDIVILTSPAIVDAFLGMIDAVKRQAILAGVIHIITNAPKATRALRLHGLEIAGQAETPGNAGILQAVLEVKRRYLTSL
jgi:uroporphyrinogen-III synthase